MLYLYISKDLNKIINHICNIIKKKPLSNPLTEEVILIDDREIKPWITHFISCNLGITFNIRILHISSYIKMLTKQFIQKNSLPIEVKNNEIIWFLLIAHKKNFLKPFFKKFKNSYLAYLYFSEISSLLKKYLKVQPSWINLWNKGKIFEKKTNFQQEFWILLIKFIKSYNKNYCFYPTLITQLLKRFNFKQEKNFFQIQNRVFYIGSVQSSVYELFFIKKMSTYLDIHFFSLFVCRVDNKIISLLKIKNKKQQLFDENLIDLLEKNITTNYFKSSKKSLFNNILLNTWGQIEQERLLLLTNFSKKTVILEKINKNRKRKKNLLQSIQYSISIDHKNNFISTPKKIKLYTDGSIQIYACSSIYLEVQVLYNNLLRILKKDLDISPHEIIIKVPKIALYAPFIKEVFMSANTNSCIPFVIYDNILNFNDNFFNSFYQLLSLPDSFFYHKEIFNLLENKFINKKFQLNIEERKFLYKLTKESSIKWGLNSKHLKEKKVSVNLLTTWSQGIKRILFSCFIKQEDNVIWKKIAPSHDYDFQISSTLEKFLIFINLLKKWKKRLSTQKNVKNWNNVCAKVINDFYIFDKTTKKNINIITTLWKNIIDAACKAHISKCSITILKLELFNKLKNKKNKKNTCIGSLVISEFHHFQYIPFKVVYMLGLNETIYPKKNKDSLFDLTRQCDYPNETNQYNLDRYFFLFTLAKVKKYFFISYIKEDNNLLDKRFPSILIKILLRYIKEELYEEIKKKCILKNLVEKRLLLETHCDYLFNKKNFTYNNYFQCFSLEWIKISKLYYFLKKDKPKYFKIPCFKKNKLICFKELINFWKNPIAYFFKHVCKTYFRKDNTDFSFFENFSINSLLRYQIKDKILQAQLTKSKKIFLFNEYKFSGKLPYKNFGEISFLEEKKLIDNLIREVKKAYSLPFRRISFDIKVKEVRLLGEIKVLKTKFDSQLGLVLLFPSVLKSQNGILLWIHHIIYCYLGGKKPSIALGTKNSEWKIDPIDKETAYFYIEKYIDAFILNFQNPILLIPSGMSWFNYIFDKKSQRITSNKILLKKSRLHFLKKWIGNKYRNGDKTDVFIKKVIPDISNSSIFNIFDITKKWLNPIYTHSSKRKNIFY